MILYKGKVHWQSLEHLLVGSISFLPILTFLMLPWFVLVQVDIEDHIQHSLWTPKSTPSNSISDAEDGVSAVCAFCTHRLVLEADTESLHYRTTRTKHGFLTVIHLWGNCLQK